MRMPPELAERARALVYGGDWTAPEPRPASTVVLLRDGVAGVEVALLQRAANLGFARGMYVFPGGALDVADAELGDPWLVAAVRETFEECGVLLTDPAPPAAAFADRERDFAGLLAEFGLKPNLAALHPFAHWVTPEVESRRFDTRFYLVPAPVEQTSAHDDSETIDSLWVRPAEALTRQAAGELMMMPPTIKNLQFLSRFASVHDAIEHARTLPPPECVLPRIRRDGDGRIVGVAMPGDDDYESLA